MANKTAQQKIPRGYKETRFGSVPTDWNLIKLGDLGNTYSGLSGKNKDDFGYGKPYIPYLNIFNNSRIDMTQFDYVNVEAGEKQNKAKYGDIFFTTSSETPEEVGMAAVLLDKLEELYLNSFCFGFRLHDFSTLIPEYARYCLRGNYIRKEIAVLAQGATRFNLPKRELLKLYIPLPPPKEQKKISFILSSWDSAILKTQKLILAKRRLKKALMQQLLTGKRRFKEFLRPWQDYHLGEIFKERKERGRKDLPLLAITSDRGVIYREEVDRKDSSSTDKSNYKGITPGDIGYNTMRMWQGVSALSSLEGIVSPAYTICVPKTDKVIGTFAAYLFKYPPIIYLFYRYSQGLVSDTLNLKFPNFKQIKVRIPQIDEQKKISAVLAHCDKEIYSLEQKLELLKQQKRGLMQKLLTGQTRVKGFGSDMEKHHA